MRQLVITQQITNRESKSIEKYFNEVSKYDLLTPEEEVELAAKVKQGDEEALQKMVKANLRFVVSVAKQYQHSGLSLQDLINEGNLGLIKAAKRFDHTKGFKFISYAVWWIRQSILKALANDSRTIRLPLNQIGSLSKIKQAYSKLEQEYEREPSPEEIAQELDSTEDKVSETLTASGKPRSMDAPLVEGETSDLTDVLVNSDSPKADREIMADSLRKEIERFLNKLPERDKDVVKMFFGIGVERSFSLDEIGQKYNLNRERIRQIKEKAIRNLRRNSSNKLLKTYLG